MEGSDSISKGNAGLAALPSAITMWLGGVTRKLEGDNSTGGLHGNYKGIHLKLNDSVQYMGLRILKYTTAIRVAKPPRITPTTAAVK